jgi:NAD(P)-dependent dehydrogenase (short-subunit alcohol dehydrogenase family)
MIVTGASSGIGAETARALVAAGAEVTLAVRDRAAGRHVAERITPADGVGSVRVATVDLADPGSVEAFLDAWRGTLHVLVANAGIMATPERHTPEGRELQFATNHLGHFQLALGLHDALAAADDPRVVVVSSVGHVNGGVLFDDIDFARTPYDPWVAYSQSKTANVLFAVAAAKRWASDGISVNALNPGRIGSTNLGRHMTTPPTSFDPSGASGVSIKNIPQGAATSVLLAGSPLVRGVTGTYFEDCAQAMPYTPGIRRGVAAHALDPDAAEQLWAMSMALGAGH